MKRSRFTRCSPTPAWTLSAKPSTRCGSIGVSSASACPAGGGRNRAGTDRRFRRPGNRRSKPSASFNPIRPGSISLGLRLRATDRPAYAALVLAAHPRAAAYFAGHEAVSLSVALILAIGGGFFVESLGSYVEYYLLDSRHRDRAAMLRS